MFDERFINALNRYADMINKWNEFHDALTEFANDFPSPTCTKEATKNLIELLGAKAFEVDCLINHQYFCDLDAALGTLNLIQQEEN